MTVARVVTCCMLLFASGCASNPHVLRMRTGDEAFRVYTRTQEFEGQRITVKGLLHWRFEDRNLYAVKVRGRGNWDAVCIPLAITEDLEPLAEGRDGKRVVVTGTVRKLTGPGAYGVPADEEAFSFAFCKDYGLVVEDLYVSGKRPIVR